MAVVQETARCCVNLSM